MPSIVATRVVKFLTVGIIGAAINIGAMIFFVEVLNFRMFVLKNLANVLTLELSVISTFFLNRFWTWNHISLNNGKRLLVQFWTFHLAILATLLLRACLFAALDLSGVNYVLNLSVGIAAAATVNYFLYDKFVFKTEFVTAS